MYLIWRREEVNFVFFREKDDVCLFCHLKHSGSSCKLLIHPLQVPTKSSILLPGRPTCGWSMLNVVLLVLWLQCTSLSRQGYRVICVEWPPYWTLTDWCVGFRALLTHLALEKVHLFGAALGGFLAQKFAEFTRPCPRVASMILCNTFTDSEVKSMHIFYWLTLT